MATTFTKTLIALAALSVATVSTSASANSFNKFPAQDVTQTVSGLQNSDFVTAKKSVKVTYSANKRIKRVVKPVPSTETRGLSYASDMGTVSRTTGFNKMKSSKFSSARAMPVMIDNNAFTAR